MKLHVNMMLAAVLAAVLSLGVVAAEAKTVVVRNDPGGNVEARLAKIAALRASGDTVRIVGRCASSCTMLIDFACVAPSARLAFHGPSSQYHGIALPPAEWDRVSRVMAAHYPPHIAAWFLREARYSAGPLMTITGTEAIRLGAKECER